MEERRFLNVSEARMRYGPTVSAWRKWIRDGSLGNAVMRFGRLVLLDSSVLDDRLARTGQLLVLVAPKKSNSQRARKVGGLESRARGGA